jgi:hypothetical protein
MSAVNEKLLGRIGALLAKAESTDSPHEAEALTAKAQQLATLHAIDLAAARERTQRGRERQSPVQRKIVIGRRGEQGLRHRINLFTVIAGVNDVRVDVARNSTYVLAFGFAGDIEVVEALYTSLATQMVAAANAAIARGEHREEVYWSEAAQAWRSDARVFRTAFNHTFVVTIQQRLVAARQAALAEDAAVHGNGDAGSSGAMVLARKADEVADFHRRTSEARGTWRGGGTTVAWSQAGERSGRSAGRAARLSRQDRLPGTRGEIA